MSDPGGEASKEVSLGSVVVANPLLGGGQAAPSSAASHIFTPEPLLQKFIDEAPFASSSTFLRNVVISIFPPLYAFWTVWESSSKVTTVYMDDCQEKQPDGSFSNALLYSCISCNGDSPLVALPPSTDYRPMFIAYSLFCSYFLASFAVSLALLRQRASRLLPYGILTESSRKQYMKLGGLIAFLLVLTGFLQLLSGSDSVSAATSQFLGNSTTGCPSSDPLSAGAFLRPVFTDNNPTVPKTAEREWPLQT